MVAPYLSRLRPAESGPRLRPRPRSRFEPAPTLPIDGLAGASLGLSPPPPDAGLAEMEAELEPDSPYRHPAGPPIASVTVGDQEIPPIRAEASAPGQGTGPRSTPTARPTPPGDKDPVHRHPVGPAGTAVPPPPAALTPGPPPRRPEPPAPVGARHGGIGTQPGPAGGREDFRPARPGADRRRTAAPPIATTGEAPAPRPGVQDRTLVPGGRASSAWRPGAPLAPPAPPSPAERPPRYADEPRHADRPRQPADTPTDRVQEMARRLRDADTAPSRDGLAAPPAGPHRALPGRVLDQPAPAPQDVTVTIGRIEVKMPAAEPAPARREPGGARNQVPSLEDYLASRTRVKGRPG